MISKRYPRCITQFMLKRDLVEADYHLNGVGRALSHVRIAAQQLRNPNGREMADYHAYAGASIDELNRIGVDQIDQHRQRAQHREGPAVIKYEPGGWYLTPEGIQHPRAHDVPLPELPDGWADEIEKAVCEMIAEVRPEQQSAAT